MTSFLVRSTLIRNSSETRDYLSQILWNRNTTHIRFGIERTFRDELLDVILALHQEMDLLEGRNSDELAISLQCQIRVENFLFRFLQARFPDFPWDAGNSMRWGFKNCIDVYSHITEAEREMSKEMLSGLISVARIRNKYAHNLNHSLNGTDLLEINSYFGDTSMLYEEFRITTPLEKYVGFCTACCVVLYMDYIKLNSGKHVSLKALRNIDFDSVFQP